MDLNTCEICENDKLKSVLDLGLHPLCDDLVPLSEARSCKEYPIEILYCNRCFTAFQKFEVDKTLLFPSSYHYRARMTGSVLNGMKDLVESAEKSWAY